MKLFIGCATPKGAVPAPNPPPSSPGVDPNESPVGADNGLVSENPPGWVVVPNSPVLLPGGIYIQICTKIINKSLNTYINKI